jgi:chemotaxis methyl-accepting protein methylase
MNQELTNIIQAMASLHGRDISAHDEVFLMKSLEKRLAATGIQTLAAYGELLASAGAEAETFFQSLTISYSEFFRNPLTFALLEQLVLPALLSEKERSGQSELRVWSAGCAAGQEAYSVAILLNELTGTRHPPRAFRIFATDLSEAALALARQGDYEAANVQNVRLGHLRKYFAGNEATYKILPEIKYRVDFSVYDLLEEGSSCPPGSIYGDFDLILCGNLLFYYRPEIRQRILDKMHRALAPGGYLVTGEAERDIIARTPGFRALAPPVPVFQKALRAGAEGLRV